jgi:hypothetical protein
MWAIRDLNSIGHYIWVTAPAGWYRTINGFKPDKAKSPEWGFIPYLFSTAEKARKQMDLLGDKAEMIYLYTD